MVLVFCKHTYTKTEVFKAEDVDPEKLDQVKVKDLYKGFTDTFPPPKVVYRKDLPWEMVWERINHSVLEVKQREVMFLMVHNILPTKERLWRLNQVDSDQCDKMDGLEDVVHLFCSCKRSQVAWSWMRRKIINRYPELQRLSDFEILHLLTLDHSDNPMDLIWLVANFVTYVWAKKTESSSYYIDLEKFKVTLHQQFVLNQKSQNKVSNSLV